MIFQGNFTFFLPEVFLAFSIIILILFVLYSKVQLRAGLVIKYPLLVDAVGVTGVWILVWVFLLVMTQPLAEFSIFLGILTSTYIIYFAKLVITLLSGWFLIIWKNDLKAERVNTFEVLVLLVFLVLSMFLLIGSNNLIMFYLALSFKV